MTATKLNYSEFETIKKIMKTENYVLYGISRKIYTISGKHS